MDAAPAARPLRIALCAGEASGDGLGAGLIAHPFFPPRQTL